MTNQVDRYFANLETAIDNVKTAKEGLAMIRKINSLRVSESYRDELKARLILARVAAMGKVFN